MRLVPFGLGQNQAVSLGTVRAINSTVYRMAVLEPVLGCASAAQLKPRGPKYGHVLYGRMYVRNTNKERCTNSKTFCLQRLLLLMPHLWVVQDPQGWHIQKGGKQSHRGALIGSNDLPKKAQLSASFPFKTNVGRSSFLHVIQRLESSCRTEKTWVLHSSQHEEQVKPTAPPATGQDGTIYLHLLSSPELCLEKLPPNDSGVHLESQKKNPAVNSRFTEIFIPELQKSAHVGHIFCVGFSGQLAKIIQLKKSFCKVCNLSFSLDRRRGVSVLAGQQLLHCWEQLNLGSFLAVRCSV